jgi:hypothetical protein
MERLERQLAEGLDSMLESVVEYTRVILIKVAFLL